MTGVLNFQEVSLLPMKDQMESFVIANSAAMDVASLPPQQAAAAQVWSLSSQKVSCQLLTDDLNQVSCISLLMTSSTALANEGLFELTLRPSLTWAVS